MLYFVKLLISAIVTSMLCTHQVYAELSSSGFGIFGIVYDSDPSTPSTRLDTEFGLELDLKSTTSQGLEFTASILFEAVSNSDGTMGGAEGSAGEIEIMYGGFTLYLGNVGDLIYAGNIVDYYGYDIGLTDFAELSTGFNLPVNGFDPSKNDVNVYPIVTVEYTHENFTAGASYIDENEEWQAGLVYTFKGFSVGGVYGITNENSSDRDAFWVVSFGGEIGSLGFALLAANSELQDQLSYGASINYDIGTTTDLSAVYSDNGMDDQQATYAVGFSHSLGGGVSIAGGVGKTIYDYTNADFGVIFDF